MHDLTEVSRSSSLATSNSLSNNHLLSPLFTALGWKDLKPAIVAAEQADQMLAAELQQAYDAYSKTPDEASKHRLQMVLDQAIGELQTDLARAKKLEKEATKRLAKPQTNSSGFLASWGNWLKQSAQTFFGSDDASLIERYAGIAQQRQESIAALSRFREGLVTQVAEAQTLASTAEQGPIEDIISPLSRRLLSAGGLPETITRYCYPTGSCNLSDLQEGVSGFVLQGEATSDQSGCSVSSAGDINGDGLGDMLVGAYDAAPGGRAIAGKTYVIFGSNQPSAWSSGTIGLSSLIDGQRGFVLQGEATYDRSGWSVSSAGDINGDRFSDMLIGAYYATPASRTSAGKTYVVFGSNQTNAWGSGVVNLSSLMNGQRGFVLQGEAAGDYSGWSVSGAGDINRDGFSDVVVGAYQADPAGIDRAGKTYVVFGSNQTNAWGSGVIDLSSLMNGQRGFVLEGREVVGCVGYSVSSAGDINGDGMDDVLVGAFGEKPAGKTYVVFGTNQANAWGSGAIILSSLMNGQRGFVLQGEAAGDYSGVSVSSAGDINGDGVKDILVGARGASSNNRINAGKTYVVFGTNQANAWGSGTLNLTSLTDGQSGFALQGEASDDYSGWAVSSAGDINSDGFADVLVGAYQADPANRDKAGKTYVVFGSNQTNAWGAGVLDLSNLIDGQRGFMLQGEAAGDYSGFSISSAGDINDDGFADVLVGAYQATPSSGVGAGKTYVIWGASSNSLQFTANTLSLAKGETVKLNESMLALTSRDSISFPLSTIAQTPLIIERLEHGSFSMTTVPGIVLTYFYPQNVSDGVIQFVHDDFQAAPAYRLVVHFSNLISFFSDAQINFLGSSPTLLNNQLLVDQGLAAMLQLSDLSATDPDDAAGGLKFILTNIQHGQFNLYNATGQLVVANISQFSQQAIFDRQVHFLHDGSQSAPIYDVAVTDSRSTTSSRAAVITFNHAPTLNISHITIDQNKAITLLPQDITATDIETFGEDIIIEATNITNGYFSYISNPNFVITAFRQFPLITGDVQFTQDGSNTNASFALRAFDGRIYTPWQIAQTKLNRRPILQATITDKTVTQGEAFGFDLDPGLFADPDGEILNYTAQLKGGAPLPKGVEFIPPTRFQGELSILTSLQVEVQAYDPRGLTATTDFTLESKASSENGVDLQKLYTSVSSIGGIAVAIAGYMWWRRKMTAHRRGFELANNLRKAANLEYHDFMRFDGDVFKSKIENFLSKVDAIQVDFYKRLSPAERKSFAVCIAEILEQRELLKPSGYGMGIYGWMLAFSVGWSQQLDFKKFEAQLTEIAQQAVTAWRAEENPTARWPYFSPTCKDKAKAFCCARPSHAGMFARDKVRLSRSEGVSLTDLKDSKHQVIDVPSSSQKDVLVPTTVTSSPRFFDSSAATSEERLGLIEKQVQSLAGNMQQVSEGMQYMHQGMQQIVGNIKTMHEEMEQLKAETRPLLRGMSSSSS